jgi:ADP-ribose pyrophosphatase
MPKQEKTLNSGETTGVKADEPGKAAKKATAAAPRRAKATGAKKRTTAKPKTPTAAKPKVKKAGKTLKPAKAETEQMLSSEVVFQGSLFRVLRDKLIEPGGRESERDIIRHNGSVVILAMDRSKDKKDPWIVVERQYRHAAQQFLWELPAGKLDAGEDALAGAQRELAEETGYSAKKWKPLAEYYPSPGFLGESMKVFVAEGLVAGDAHPEDDEEIEFRLVKLSDLLKMIEKGAILDGKTLSSVLLYARLKARKRKK